MGACCCKKKAKEAKKPTEKEEGDDELATVRTQAESALLTAETAEMSQSTEPTALTHSTLYSSQDSSVGGKPGAGRQRRRQELLSSYENVDEIKEALKEEEDSVRSWKENYAAKGEDSNRSQYCLHRQQNLRLFKTEIDKTQVPSLYRPTGKADDKSVSLLGKGEEANYAPSKKKKIVIIDDDDGKPLEVISKDKLNLKPPTLDPAV